MKTLSLCQPVCTYPSSFPSYPHGLGVSCKAAVSHSVRPILPLKILDVQNICLLLLLVASCSPGNPSIIFMRDSFDHHSLGRTCWITLYKLYELSLVMHALGSSLSFAQPSASTSFFLRRTAYHLGQTRPQAHSVLLAFPRNACFHVWLLWGQNSLVSC